MSKFFATVAFLGIFACASAFGDEEPQHKLYEAISEGNVKNVKEILDKKPELAKNSRSPSLVSPLMFAIINNISPGTALSMAKVLVSKGADVNAVSNERSIGISAKGTTALHLAANNLDLNLIQFLLRAGANPSASDSNGNLPQDIAGAVKGESKIKNDALKILTEAHIQRMLHPVRRVPHTQSVSQKEDPEAGVPQ